MPELPEVEHFRQILLPLIVASVAETSASASTTTSTTNVSSPVIGLECPPPLPTKRFPSQEAIDLINDGCYVMKDVLRKGKVLCIVLQKQLHDTASSAKKNGRGGKRKRQQHSNLAEENIGITGRESTLYLSLHMGMTGRISSPNNVPSLESLSGNDAYPPPHTHLIIRSNGKEAAFSDPRRFGSVLVNVGDNDATTWSSNSIPTFQDIAPDALHLSEAHCTMLKSTTFDPDATQPTIVEQLTNKKKGIKGLLLDQRAVVSGIGNWVADELLYRSCIHPDQSYLTTDEAHALLKEIQYVLTTAIACSKNGVDYPQEWLFHRRWRNGGGKGHDNSKDFDGKSVSFVQSGGRSTAVVPSRQKLKARKRVCQTTTKKSISNNECAGASLTNGEVHRDKKEAKAIKESRKVITSGSGSRKRSSSDEASMGIESKTSRRRSMRLKN